MTQEQLASRVYKEQMVTQVALVQWELLDQQDQPETQEPRAKLDLLE